MNHYRQIRNLVEFTSIFLSGDLQLKLQSTDYYREKYDKYIGIPLKYHNKQTDTYKEWSKIWGEHEDINSIMLYLISLTRISIHNVNENESKHWLVSTPISDIINTFNTYIGDINQINDKIYSNVHPIIRKEIISEILNANIRYFKLYRILK